MNQMLDQQNAQKLHRNIQMSKMDKATTQTSGNFSSFKDSSLHLQLFPQPGMASFQSNDSFGHQKDR